MKRRDLFLFLSFIALFVLFAIFQNFSFPKKQLQQLTNKDFFDVRLHKFIPGYSFKNYIGQNMEVPYGYKEEIQRRIASEGTPIVFDDKNFIKNELKAMPVYRDIKDLIEMSNREEMDANPCIAHPSEAHNNCFTEYPAAPSSFSTEDVKSGSVKVKANPLRKTASIKVPGAIESQISYDNESNNVNVQFRKDLDQNADLKFELDSEQKSGTINIDVRW